MIANSSLLSECGWALTSLGTPWVAHLVCPIPMLPFILLSFKWFFKTSSLPSFFSTVILLPSEIAIPAESYPRYSKRDKPLIRIGNGSFGPEYPTIPQIISPFQRAG